MKTKTYNIMLADGQTLRQEVCTSYSLQKFVKEFIDEDYQLITIMSIPNVKKNGKLQEQNEIEKSKFYNRKYSLFSKRYKNSKISENEYKEIIDVLKKLKKQCETKEEFETKFIEYQNKKNTNNIPPYNVSI